MMATSSARSEPIGQGGCSRGKCARQPLDQPVRLVDVLAQHLDDGGDIDVGVLVVPAVVVGHHGDRRVADLGFAGELGFGHVGHADHRAAPAAIEVALGPRRELRPLHDEVGAAARDGNALRPRRRLDQIDQHRAHRIGHRHVRHAARPEEAFLAREGAVDELVDQHEMPGRELLLQRAAGRDRHQVGDARPLQGVDVGAVVDGRGRHLVAAAVARQEADRQPVELGEQDLVGRRRPRARPIASQRLFCSAGIS